MFSCKFSDFFKTAFFTEHILTITLAAAFIKKYTVKDTLKACF